MSQLEVVWRSVVRSLMNELGLSRSDAEDAAQEAVLGVLETAERAGVGRPSDERICRQLLSAARHDAIDEMRGWSDRRSAEAVE